MPGRALCADASSLLLNCPDTPRTAALNRDMDPNSPGVPMRMGLLRTSHTPHAHAHPTPVLGDLLGTAETAAPAPDGDTARLQ
eukprot:3331943-Prymnesium_polylepis.1